MDLLPAGKCQVLLWPFGGICFTTRPSGRNSREKLVDDLYIVAAVRVSQGFQTKAGKGRKHELEVGGVSSCICI